MDERQALTQEMMLKAILNQSNEGVDLLQLFSNVLGDIDEGVKQANAGIAAVKQDTEQINSKIDKVLEKLNGLENAFSDLKNENRELEQKLILLDSKLSRMEEALSGDEELEDYYGLCQSLYNNWDELDPLTRRLIPVAEYLFSKLQKYDKPDFSPVILELCRALENEFLLKIFDKYTRDVLKRKGRELDKFFALDKANSFLTNKTGMFIKAIRNASKPMAKPEYTLGQMNTILSLTNDPKVVSQSPLLQDFKDYLTTATVANDLLNAQYIKKINDLVEKYRNPSAHPGFMTLDKAQKCKDIMPERIDYLMECVSL